MAVDPPPPSRAPHPPRGGAPETPLPLGARWQRLKRVLAYARPHVGLLVVSMLLMAFQSAASNARILLLYPILTRAFDVSQMARAAEDPASPAEAGAAKAMLDTAQKKGGALLRAFDEFISGMNARTSHWVPESWATSPKEVDRYATLWTVFLLFLVFIVVMSASAFFEDFVNEIVRQRILMDVRRDLCGKLLAQPMAFYDAARRGEVVQRVLDDVHGFSAALRLVFSSVVEGVLNLGFGILVLGAFSWPLTGVCAVGMMSFIPMRRFAARIRRQAKSRQTQTARRVEVLLQMLSGIRTVKAFRAEERKVAEFAEADREVYRRSLKVQRTKSLSDAATEFLNNLLVMVLAVGGSFVVLRGVLPMQPVTLLLFLSQVGNLYKPAKRLVKDLNGFNDVMASVERVFDVMDLPPPPPDPVGAPPFPGLAREIRFEGVGFSYRPGVPVLADVSFTIGRGETVALVGPSGAGKSTICDLLLRFYEPTEGGILVDGRPLPSFQRDSWLAKTAVVTQDPFLFHTTILENVRLGRADATEAEIEAAAKAAQIHDHVATMPQGYESEVGERGARLSGGQRQRLTIARALVRDPSILVLDEATASLDAESERAVQEALERLQLGRTTLVVAHRLATVQRADRIVVLEAGRIVDQGTHRELMARGGLYARLCAMQNLGAEAAPRPSGGAPVTEVL